MTPIARALIVATTLALPLGGCVNFDPMEWMAGDWFSNKKPLPGERKPLFPEGVPGVSKGVPPDLMKGNQAAALQDQQSESSPVLLPEEKAKPKAKPKPKPKVVQETSEPERRPTPVTVRPPQQQPAKSQTQWPEPPAKQQQQQQQVQWPDPPGQTRPPSGGGVQWPDPPASR